MVYTVDVYLFFIKNPRRKSYNSPPGNNVCPAI